MYEFMKIFKRDIINLIKNPILVNYNTLFPFFMILILGFLTSGNYGNHGVNAYDYYGVTILIYLIANVSITASNSFMEKKLMRSNLRTMYAPISNAYIYMAKIFATFVFTGVCFMLLIFIGELTLHINYGGRRVIFIIIMVFVFCLFSSTLGILFCTIFKSEEIANKILSLLNNIFGVLGGVFFQLDGYGKTVQLISKISPVKWVVDGMLKIIYDNDFSYFIPTIAILLILTGIMMLGCKRFFRTEDYV